MGLKNIDLPSETRAPTLHGTFSHIPDGTLSRIAAKLAIPISSLSTLQVPTTTYSLYAAILEYAALSDPLDEHTSHPLNVDSVEYRRTDDDDDDEDNEALNASYRLLRRLRMHDRSLVEGGKGLRTKRLPVPKFQLALGEIAISWPPPPHLTAEFLNKQRYQRHKSKSNVDPHAVSSLDDTTSLGIPACEANDLATQDVENSTAHRVIHLVHYSVGEPKSNDCKMSTYRELLLISQDGPQFLRDFATEILQWRIDKEYYDGDGSMFSLYRYKTSSCGSGDWVSEGLKRARQPSSVILPKGQMQSILDDVENFLNLRTRKWYIAHGLPHRRSYLFYGPPGTGKTSTIRAIGSVFRLNCCFLSMTTAGFSNQSLGDALSQIPANALIVLEDVDALFNEDRKNSEAPSLTFSGLLNALDGLISVEGVITVMTTNFIDKLDRALIRGGRVDRRFHFAKASNAQIEGLFLSFYPDASKDTVRNFVEAVAERREGEEARSIATLQQLFIDQRENSAEECAQAVPLFFERYFPEGSHTTDSERRFLRGIV